jgi:hypothetical protein
MAVEAFATTNALSALAAASYTWSNAYAGSDRAYVNDGKLDRRVVVGSPTTSIDVIIDLGSAVALRGIAILNHNFATLGSGVAVVVRSDSAAGMGTAATVKTSTTLTTSLFSYSSREPRNKDHLLAWGTTTARRYWQLQFSWTGTITNFSIGELFAYTSITSLTRHSQYGSDDNAEQTLSTEVTTLSGDRRSNFLAGPIRQKRLVWGDMTSTQRDQLLALYREARGNVSNVLWATGYIESGAAASSAEQDCMLGHLGSPDFASPQHDYNLFNPSEFVLTSRGREIGA